MGAMLNFDKNWIEIPDSAEKGIPLPRKSRSIHRRSSVKEGLQGPAQVFSCEYCEIYKDTYLEKYLNGWF